MDAEPPMVETPPPASPLPYAAPKPALKTWPVVLAWVGIWFSVPTILIGVAGIPGAIQERNYSGERWGLVGILFICGAALLWQFMVSAFLLLPAAIEPRSRLSRRMRVLICLVVALAFGLNLVAVVLADTGFRRP